MDRAQALAETAQIRKDYADLKNMFDQLKKRAEELQKGEEQQSRGSYRFLLPRRKTGSARTGCAPRDGSRRMVQGYQEVELPWSSRGGGFSRE